MKRIIKKTVSILLVAFMIFGSAPLAGFVGVELPEFDSWDIKASAVMTYKDYSYTVIGDKVKITGFNKKASGYIDIPSEIYGDPVTWIGNAAFSGCKKITGVSIPSGVKTIGGSAFSGCENLDYIYIPYSVEEIGAGAFGGTAYYYDETNWDYGILYIGAHLIKAKPSSLSVSGKIVVDRSIVTIANSAFDSCIKITDIVLPDSLSNIGDYAFYGCKALKNIDFGKSVEEIGSFAFAQCVNLTKVILPDSITSVGKSAFCGCSSIQKVETGNGLSYIPNDAFSECVSLTRVVTGKSLESIGEYAFFDCKNLSSIVLTKKLDNIGGFAFLSCRSLDDIYFSGSEEDWSNITIYDLNDELKRATVHYNYCIHLYVSTITKFPCEEDGTKTYTCVDCADSYEETLPKTGHNPKWIVSKEASCVEDGLKLYECTTCKKALSTEVIPEKGHQTETIETKATCTEDGRITKKCKICSEIISDDIIPKTGHNRVMVPAKEPTYDSVGKTEGAICSACKFVFVEQQVIPKLPAPAIKVIRKGDKSSIDYGDTIIITVEAYNLPDDAKIYWYIRGEKVAEGTTFEYTHNDTAAVFIDVKVVDADGNVITVNGEEVANDILLKCYSNFFDVIIAFFRKLFGTTRRFEY